MSDGAYITIFSLLITTMAATIINVTTSILSYLKSRDAVEASRVNTIGIAAVKEQGDVNAESTRVVHGMLNSQLAAWKAELITHTEAAIEAAHAKGVAAGIEQAEKKVADTLVAKTKAKADAEADLLRRGPMDYRLGPDPLNPLNPLNHPDPPNAGPTDKPA
jgi:hypothetical protein